MKLNIIIAILFGVFCILINGQLKCPNGKPSLQNCSSENPCPSNSTCYRHNSKTFCCGELDSFCPTKMHTYTPVDGKIYSWKTVGKKWYSVKMGDVEVSCPLPISYAYKELKELVLPVDFSVKHPKLAPKACNLNSNCRHDEFCGEAANPTFETSGGIDMSGKVGDKAVPLSFCYKFQNFGKPAVKSIKKDVKGLTPCDTNANCTLVHGNTTFCFLEKGINVNFLNKTGTLIQKPGVCAEAHICQVKHQSIQGSLPKSNQFCRQANDCRISNANPSCVPIPGFDKNEERMCCHDSQSQLRCDHGSVVTPVKRCTKFASCNNDTNQPETNKWCDWKGFCCEDLDNKIWRCPDGATPVFNEPRCYNANTDLGISTGLCPQSSGDCFYGHCCVSWIPMPNGDYLRGTLPYITNVKCDQNRPPPFPFQHVFCDPGKQRLIFTGLNHFNGETQLKSDKKCRTNSDCDENWVCVLELRGTQRCYLSPLLSPRRIAALFWLWPTVVSWACCVIFGILTFVFSRLLNVKSSADEDRKDEAADEKEKIN